MESSEESTPLDNPEDDQAPGPPPDPKAPQADEAGADREPTDPGDYPDHPADGTSPPANPKLDPEKVDEDVDDLEGTVGR